MKRPVPGKGVGVRAVPASRDAATEVELIWIEKRLEQLKENNPERK